MTCSDYSTFLKKSFLYQISQHPTCGSVHVEPTAFLAYEGKTNDIFKTAWLTNSVGNIAIK